MNAWKVTWWDGLGLRVTIVPPCEPYNLLSAATNSGVFLSGIISMERIGQ